MLRIEFPSVRARVAAQEELIGHGTGNYQTAKPGEVVVETGFRGVVFVVPFPVFKELVPDAVYDPDTREFRAQDPEED